MIRLASCSLAVVLLNGCASFQSEMPDPVIRRSLIDFQIVDRLPGKPITVGGTATYNLTTGVCTIRITASTYPSCIAHEVMHCISGAWHDERPNSEFCESDVK